MALCCANARADVCPSPPATELEQLFCELKAERPSELPFDQREFRNNPPATQRLLLKRPAARAGRALPQASAAVQPPAQPRPQSQARPSQQSPPQTSNRSPVPANGAAAGTALTACRLRAEAIECPRERYQRVRNGAQRSPPERLELAPITSANRPDSYATYLRAMAALGLGEEAMSYTKFAHFAELEPQYHQRLGTMYQALRRDRAQLGPAPRRGGGPASLAACYELVAGLIVCDDVNSTWLFQAQL